MPNNSRCSLECLYFSTIGLARTQTMVILRFECPGEHTCDVQDHAMASFCLEIHRRVGRCETIHDASSVQSARKSQCATIPSSVGTFGSGKKESSRVSERSLDAGQHCCVASPASTRGAFSIGHHRELTPLNNVHHLSASRRWVLHPHGLSVGIPDMIKQTSTTQADHQEIATTTSYQVNDVYPTARPPSHLATSDSP